MLIKRFGFLWIVIVMFINNLMNNLKIMRELDKVLDSNEKVFWEGAPNFLPFVVGRTLLILLIAIIFIVVVVLNAASKNFGGGLLSLLLAINIIWIGVPVLLIASIFLYLSYKRTYYAITNKRVIIQKGIIGRDFQIVDFDKITNAEVNIGVFDKLLSRSSGSILISTAGTFTYGKHGPIPRPYVLSNIPNPYEVFKFFKKVAHSVKTDIEYPNVYRPKTNLGYRTSYNPKK